MVLKLSNHFQLVGCVFMREAGRIHQKNYVVLKKFHRKPAPNNGLVVGWNDYLSYSLKSILMNRPSR
jgi:hypothetical protein